MALASLLFLITAANGEGLSPHEGMLEVPGGRVWYRVAGSGTRMPLILLHGGPGGSSHEHLKELTLPVLYTTGRFDLATPSTMDFLHRVTPDSRMVVFEKSEHMTMLVERERYLTVLRQFPERSRERCPVGG